MTCTQSSVTGLVKLTLLVAIVKDLVSMENENVAVEPPVKVACGDEPKLVRQARS